MSLDIVPLQWVRGDREFVAAGFGGHYRIETGTLPRLFLPGSDEGEITPDVQTAKNLAQRHYESLLQKRVRHS